MTPFADIEREATLRAGGAQSLADRLSDPKDAAGLVALPDDRYLSEMSRRIFQAGLKHSLVDAKWPAFEEVFLGFVPQRVRALPDEALEAMMGDARLIRHWGKIKSVRHNAAAMCEIAAEAGSFGRWLAGWPAGRTVELWDELGKRFTQLGGNSGPYYLRMVGRDTFILTEFVVKGLNRWGAFEGTPKGRKDRAAVQDAFLAWQRESGRPLAHLSRILALSVD